MRAKYLSDDIWEVCMVCVQDIPEYQLKVDVPFPNFNCKFEINVFYKIQ